ncbi:N-carbamoylputrescine amidase [Lentilactobacillus parafarraginis]|uniref:N-carbamoylputrescine amidase n=2 Tax=Lentilactobacillus parafarraginis TaxID=390842 RepID=A0A5R9CUK5_9LACO|nr:N-carbamoylputrescine amidase [Lentilactobacillus parafarraginis]TLQ19022.1 N-carbamoylputrescine amidase [Lentilactobacillus parafarraginis]
MKKLMVATTQMACSWDVKQNVQKAEDLVNQAAQAGAKIVLLQELFERQYFPQKQKPEFMNFASPQEDDLAVNELKKLAKKLKIVIPVSFFEKKNQNRYNSLTVIDADGTILETYRKSHIPDDVGYEEKYYFTPGDTGFKVWNTQYGKIGIGICWDQWFPEAARCMALQGAQFIFYPSAIGSVPGHPDIDSRGHWQRTIQGHAAANLVPIIVSNRVGLETIDDSQINFYGSSFITDQTGKIVEQADDHSESVLVHSFDLEKIQATQNSWGLFRDRRPDLYKPILSLDGNVR